MREFQDASSNTQIVKQYHRPQDANRPTQTQNAKSADASVVALFTCRIRDKRDEQLGGVDT